MATKKKSKAESVDAKLIESLVYGLKETLQQEIASRAKMAKLIESELFNLRTVQKELVEQFGEIDKRVAKMIDYLNTFPDHVSKVVLAALQGRGWGDAVPVQHVERGIEFMKGGKITVGKKPEKAGKPQGGFPLGGSTGTEVKIRPTRGQS